jgi:hypothetical protein
MTVPILIQSAGDQFSASLLGSPELHCVRPSKSEAIAALKETLAKKLATGEIVNLEIAPAGVSGLSGRFADDPELRQICREIYQARDLDTTP